MEEKIIEFLTEKLSIPKDEIKNDAILTDIGVDSVRFLSVLLDFEKEFGVKINDRDIESLTTAGDLIRMVSEKKEQ